MTTRRFFSNTAPELTLASSITNSATSLSISGSFTGWPTQFPFFATIDYGTASAEVVSVTNISGTAATIVRGQDGTSAISHTAGATFDQTVVAKDLDEANLHTSSNSGVHGVSGSVVGTTDTQTLTNKTLTNPTINNPTITGATSTNLTATGDATHSAITGQATTAGGKVFSGKNSSAVEKISVNDAGNLTTLGTLTSVGCASTGPVSGTTGAFTGAVTVPSVAATGAVTGASSSVTGTAAANAVTATTSVTGASIVASGAAGTVSGVLRPTVFATTAARDTAIPSPTAGMTVYITAESRKHTHNGSTWVGDTVVKKYSGTTDVNGDLTVTHNLGFTPTAIVPSPNNPVRGATSASILVALLADDASFGATTFRVRAIDDSGAGSAQMANTAIAFSAAIS